MSSGREAHGKENPRKLYAVGLRTEPAPLVRGSSRRITIMRFRPANIRVINRRNSRLTATCAASQGRITGEERKKRKNRRLHLTGHSISEFLLRPYQRALVDHWRRPKPARMASFFTGADTEAA